MPQTVNCPQCNGAVSVSDQAAGKRVQCHKCSKQFLAPGIVASSNDDDDWLSLDDNDEAPLAPPTARSGQAMYNGGGALYDPADVSRTKSPAVAPDKKTKPKPADSGGNQQPATTPPAASTPQAAATSPPQAPNVSDSDDDFMLGEEPLPRPSAGNVFSDIPLPPPPDLTFNQSGTTCFAANDADFLRTARCVLARFQSAALERYSPWSTGGTARRVRD